jgi:hypothetical protein
MGTINGTGLLLMT